MGSAAELFSDIVSGDSPAASGAAVNRLFSEAQSKFLVYLFDRSNRSFIGLTIARAYFGLISMKRQ